MNNIIRVEHSKNYTVISNDAIRDKRISLKARGLHHLLLSYPDNWRISVEHLAKEVSDKDARTAIQSGLKELEEFGYLTREQVRDKKGRITGWENVVRELPQAGFPIVDKSTSGKHHNRKNRKRENPGVDNPPMENPATENQYLINTDSYELSNYEVSIPPNPPSGGTDGGLGEKIASLEESGIPTNPPILDQQNQPSNSNNDTAFPEDKDSAPARDNSTTDTRSGAYRMEQRFRQVSKLPAYRTGIGANGIKKEFLQYLCSTYLPKTSYYRENGVDMADAKAWVTKREDDRKQDLVEARYEQMLAAAVLKATAQPSPPRHDPLEGTEAIAPEFVQKLREIANLARSQKK